MEEKKFGKFKGSEEVVKSRLAIATDAKQLFYSTKKNLRIPGHKIPMFWEYIEANLGNYRGWTLEELKADDFLDDMSKEADLVAKGYNDLIEAGATDEQLDEYYETKIKNLFPDE